jgi:hypothetical protein
MFIVNADYTTAAKPSVALAVASTIEEAREFAGFHLRRLANEGADCPDSVSIWRQSPATGLFELAETL